MTKVNAQMATVVTATVVHILPVHLTTTVQATVAEENIHTAYIFLDPVANALLTGWYCTDDSHCSCPSGQKGKCHKEVTFNNFHISSHFCECQAPSTTSTTTTTTTTLPLVPLACRDIKISVIESIAENIHVEDSRASLCPSNNKHQSSEAYVIHKCNSTERSSWTRGLSVKSGCKSIPAYTPISTFSGNNNDMAGFFVQCTDSGHGLKIAAQTCSHAPMILTLNDTTTPRMSDFFTIFQHV
ncbi:uncharacterized protein LOC133192873 [Saccostrea echinata]|uniref:uncharacterized protein LOC133192873 n=1 Tax=Saccostrea echinata TaxID=191078 RepID=UPI002A809269|nr:uncharacterized protein LOC133192873 [Saccostrea echinata]